ncbi:hypothetical protein AVEN_209442-1 [Araneus ventricosus]|uniref:Uncharacterized protein n=1 Tax=Araneus ventricosus TaxID=182803 RepID=A0A4Y2MQK0_ARAVE|nr:hypothetical protein AVEN_209442-1 [Araneus ventricosus]
MGRKRKKRGKNKATLGKDNDEMENLNNKRLQVRKIFSDALNLAFLSKFNWGGRGGLVERFQPRSRRVPGSKPDSTENPTCIGPVAR